MTPDSREQLADRIGLNPSAIQSRLAALGLTEKNRASLRELAPAVAAQSGPFLDELYNRFRAVGELAGFLGNDDQVARLKKRQERYLFSLFDAELDWEYVLSRVEIGAMHHKVRLTPQWFLATYAHFVVAHLPLLFRACGTAEEGLTLATALLKSVIFDATVILDAYGMAEELSLRNSELQMPPATEKGSDAQNETGGEKPERNGILTRASVTTLSVGERRGYIGLTDEHLRTLLGLSGTWTAALPWILDDFYKFFTTQAEIDGLVDGNAVPRLKQQVRSYWQEFSTGEFDRIYATSRVRVGLVHERIGLSPQWYLVGLSIQAEGLLRAAVAGDPSGLPAILDAFVRGLFFDVSYVVDAYMQARAATILRTEGYASQLVAGLTSGVVVIDGDRRVVSVNRTLVEYLRVDGAMLFRLPIEHILPIAELPTLLERVATGQRAVVTGKMGGRQCRVSALPLEAWPGVRGRPLAIVVDDISELVRLAADSDQTSARLAALIRAVDVTVWEMDPLATMIELVSEPVLALTGYRDVYFLGRRDAWLQCVSPADRARFQAYTGTIPAQGRGTLEYRMVRADGREIWVRTMLRRADGVIFGVTVDITNERLAEQRGWERDQAVARDQAKSDLLATMSHEIRTPLNGVVGMLDYLLGSPLDAQYVPHVRTAQESALELLELLNDILDLSKLEAGRMELHPKQFDLSSLIEGLQDLFGPQASAKGLFLRVTIAEGLCGAWIGDAHRIRQILVNLFSNAIKFTKVGGITLDVRSTEEGLRFTVDDTGPGIPEEKRGLLFHPFSQAHVSMGGTGLGLSISRKLAELMNGGITFSARPSGGSSFSVSMALIAAEEEELPNGEGREVTVLMRENQPLIRRLAASNWRVEGAPSLDASVCFIDDVALLPELPGDVPLVVCGAQRPELGRYSRKGPTFRLGLSPINSKSLIEILSGLLPARAAERFGGEVLVAEDNPVSQRVVTLMLERLGFDVEVAVNGSLAVDAAKRKAYALVLMDMLMPEMGGLEACRLIRQESLNRRTPIIALTANAFEQDRAACLSAGMDEVLTKPLQMAALQQAVSRFSVQRPG